MSEKKVQKLKKQPSKSKAASPAPKRKRSSVEKETEQTVGADELAQPLDSAITGEEETAAADPTVQTVECSSSAGLPIIGTPKTKTDLSVLGPFSNDPILDELSGAVMQLGDSVSPTLAKEKQQELKNVANRLLSLLNEIKECNSNIDSIMEECVEAANVARGQVLSAVKSIHKTADPITPEEWNLIFSVHSVSQSRPPVKKKKISPPTNGTLLENVSLIESKISKLTETESARSVLLTEFQKMWTKAKEVVSEQPDTTTRGGDEDPSPKPHQHGGGTGKVSKRRGKVL